MDQTQLELDLQATQQKAKENVSSENSAHVVSLSRVLEMKNRRKLKKVYDAILESVQHIGNEERRYK